MSGEASYPNLLDTRDPTQQLEKVNLNVEANPRPHLVVTGMVCYQAPDEQPIGVETRYARDLETDEQPYIRKIKVGPAEWVPLDLGWLKGCSLVVIENTPNPLQVNPTEAASEEARKRVIEISLNHGPPSPALLVHPGTSQSFYPAGEGAGTIFLRSRAGTVKATVTIFPR